SGCNTNNTRIWVKVPNIPANSNKTIYLYYGNPNATSMSNGDLVFEFFDDFEGTSLNTSKWIIEYSHFPYSVSGGILYIDLRSTEDKETTFRAGLPFSLSDGNVRNYVFEAYVRVNGIPNPDTSWVLSGFAVGRGAAGLGWDYNFMLGWEGVNDRFALHSWIGSMRSIHLQVNNNQWYIYYLHVVSNNNATGCIGNVCANANWDIGRGTYHLRIGGQGSYSEYWYDWVRVRKYTSPEPTISLGNEQRL
ncbi:MAG: DUF2341 domain-containing protein, partial [Candidatus Aenigmarchaeota archaeon]|nr:DUF2341 domain-containing protein [Candidatus Aenigmarchaeota archaeon]